MRLDFCSDMLCCVIASETDVRYLSRICGWSSVQSQESRLIRSASRWPKRNVCFVCVGLLDVS
jgi:hypothetical protein